MSIIERMNFIQASQIVLAIGFIWLAIYVTSKRRQLNSYQRTIMKYFDVMRWYGFNDGEIADMLHEIKSHEELKQAIKKAVKSKTEIR